jgi:hypothetical protein
MEYENPAGKCIFERQLYNIQKSSNNAETKLYNVHFAQSITVAYNISVKQKQQVFFRLNLFCCLSCPYSYSA